MTLFNKRYPITCCHAETHIRIAIWFLCDMTIAWNPIHPLSIFRPALIQPATHEIFTFFVFSARIFHLISATHVRSTEKTVLLQMSMEFMQLTERTVQPLTSIRSARMIATKNRARAYVAAITSHSTVFWAHAHTHRYAFVDAHTVPCEWNVLCSCVCSFIHKFAHSVDGTPHLLVEKCTRNWSPGLHEPFNWFGSPLIWARFFVASPRR